MIGELHLAAAITVGQRWPWKRRAVLDRDRDRHLLVGMRGNGALGGGQSRHERFVIEPAGARRAGGLGDRLAWSDVAGDLEHEKSTRREYAQELSDVRLGVLRLHMLQDD